MARRDGTGPMGLGSNTGRGMGSCNVTTNLGENRGFGMGRGMGSGVGLSCRGGVGRNNTMAPLNQSDLLAQEKVILENRLNLVNTQLNTLQDGK